MRERERERGRKKEREGVEGRGDGGWGDLRLGGWMDGRTDVRMNAGSQSRLPIQYLCLGLLPAPLPARLLGVHLGLPGSDQCPVTQLALL